MSAGAELQALAQAEERAAAESWPTSFEEAVERAFHVGRKLAFSEAAAIVEKTANQEVPEHEHDRG